MPFVMNVLPVEHEASPSSTAVVVIAGEVRAGAGLGECDCGYQLAGHDARQPAVVLGLVTIFEEVRHAHIVVHREA